MVGDAMKNGHAAPKGFVSKAERQRREEARQAKERQAAEAAAASRRKPPASVPRSKRSSTIGRR